MTEEAPQRPERTGPAVYDGIAAVMLFMSQEGISKDRKSGDGGGPKFQFRGIDDIYNALSPVMAANRIMMLPRMISRNQVERSSRNGGAMFYTTVEAEFDIVSAEDGSSHTVRTFGEAMDSSDKSTNKAMSAALKYACLQVFMIPTEGDNDADAATHEVEPRGQQRQQNERQREQPRDQRGGGRQRGADDAAPDAEAKKYLDRNLIPGLKKCATAREIDEFVKKEAGGIARLKAEFVGLFNEWDHVLGLAYADADDVPF